MKLEQLTKQEPIIDLERESSPQETQFIRSSVEGVLIDYNIDSDYPEVVAAMFATLFGAASLVSEDISESDSPVVKIIAGNHIFQISKIGEHIIALLPSSDVPFSQDEIDSFLIELPNEP